MSKQAIDLFNEYNSKSIEALRAFGEINVASFEKSINKQVELSNTIVEASLATGKQITSAKTPADVLQASAQLLQDIADRVNGFVKESTADAVKTGDEVKAVVEDAVKLNAEYAGKVVDNSVEAVKKAASKSA